MPDTFAITILFLIVSTAVAAFIKGRSRDKCLKGFMGNFVILEMTEKGVGLGIEAGYAVAKGKPVIVLIKEKQKLSNTMQGIANVVIRYSQPEEIEIFTHNKSLQGTPASLRP